MDHEYEKGLKKKSPKKPWLEQSTKATQLIFARSEGAETPWSMCGGLRVVIPHSLLLMMIQNPPVRTYLLLQIPGEWWLQPTLLLIGLETERSNP